ncbi:MAG: haloacid dehalogenase [Deltaproteobacteria bacterium]|nr:haloacid dehalogenase [Deltaproteobacteria bacterium]
MIDPKSLAFDIDGVFADTMTLFLDIARDEYNINSIKYEDITNYMLEECLDIDTKTINEIIIRIMDGSHAAELKPLDGAVEVLTKIGRDHGALLFVTARPYIGQIQDWILKLLPLEPELIEIVATGNFEDKADVILSRGYSCFVEDRLDTCFLLKDAGIIPVLFKQPWNRGSHPFLEVDTWSELESMIEFEG